MKKDRKKCYKVYMHIAPNGKKYIGITRQENPKKRWGSNGCGYMDNAYFWKAIQKYGWNNFQHEILFENLTKEEAEQKEIDLIAKYQSNKAEFGYNISSGGAYNPNVTLKPVKQYTREGVFVEEHECIKYASIDTNISKSSINLCCTNKLKTAGGFIWRYADQELTEQYLTWCNRDERKDNNIAVRQYSKSGEFIQEYESMTIAASKNNTSLTSIILCCKGEYKSVADYIWRYAWEELTQEHLEWCNTLSSDGLKKEINQYLRDGTFVCTYESIGEAHLKTGINRCRIGKCCRGVAKTAGDYLWKFSNEELTSEHIKWCNRIESSKGKHIKTSVVQYTMGGVFIATYESLNEAERATGISRKSIVAVCKGDREQVGDYIWRYASEISNPTAPLFSTSSAQNEANKEGK